MEPADSHATIPHSTVPRHAWTAAPKGRMTSVATRSEEIAVASGTPNKIVNIGVIKAPPPAPVRPTRKPTPAAARIMYPSKRPDSLQQIFMIGLVEFSACEVGVSRWAPQAGSPDGCAVPTGPLYRAGWCALFGPACHEQGYHPLGLLLVLGVRRVGGDRPLPPDSSLLAAGFVHNGVERLGAVLDAHLVGGRDHVVVPAGVRGRSALGRDQGVLAAALDPHERSLADLAAAPAAVADDHHRHAGVQEGVTLPTAGALISLDLLTDPLLGAWFVVSFEGHANSLPVPADRMPSSRDPSSARRSPTASRPGRRRRTGETLQDGGEVVEPAKDSFLVRDPIAEGDPMLIRNPSGGQLAVELPVPLQSAGMNRPMLAQHRLQTAWFDLVEEGQSEQEGDP